MSLSQNSSLFYFADQGATGGGPGILPILMSHYTNRPFLNLQCQRSAVLKLITLISKVLLDDGNGIINPQGIFRLYYYILLLIM